MLHCKKSSEFYTCGFLLMSVACIIVIVMNNTLVLNAILRDFIPQTIGGGGRLIQKKIIDKQQKKFTFSYAPKVGGGGGTS